jgi:predicted transcriptional regulator
MSQGERERASRRERQILDILHRVGPGTVGEVLEQMADAPSYSTVRTLLRVMEEKGLVVHTERGKAYVYTPATSPKAARRLALRHLVTTFFQGSAEDAAIALLDEAGIDAATRKRLSQRIAQAWREGR